jgi:hypothetical protein
MVDPRGLLLGAILRVLQGRNVMAIWKSELTEEMVSSLSDQEISLLVEALNDAVQEVCENWGMK